MELDQLELQRISAGKYQDKQGRMFLLRPVDRVYSGKKKPTHYLEILDNGRAKYLSGLFPSSFPNLFTCDLLDNLGVKILYICEVIREGESLRFSRKVSGAELVQAVNKRVS